MNIADMIASDALRELCELERRIARDIERAGSLRDGLAALLEVTK